MLAMMRRFAAQQGRLVASEGISGSWDLSTASYDNVSFDFSAYDSRPHGGKYSKCGLSYYILGTVGGTTLIRLTMTSAYDLSTASYHSESAELAEVAYGYGVGMSADCSVVYVGDSDEVHTYSMTDCDVSTLTYVATASVPEISVSSGIQPSYDGLSLLIANRNGLVVYKYTMSSANDISDLTYYSDSGTTFTGMGDSIGGMCLKPDNAKLFVLIINTATSAIIYDYDMTSFDLSTLTASGYTLDVYSEETTPYSVDVNSDGTKMSVLGTAADTVFSYSMGD